MTKNIGALCSNCAHQGGSNPKNCKKCMKQDGRPGWDPAKGVQGIPNPQTPLMGKDGVSN